MKSLDIGELHTWSWILTQTTRGGGSEMETVLCWGGGMSTVPNDDECSVQAPWLSEFACVCLQNVTFYFGKELLELLVWRSLILVTPTAKFISIWAEIYGELKSPKATHQSWKTETHKVGWSKEVWHNQSIHFLLSFQEDIKGQAERQHILGKRGRDVKHLAQPSLTSSINVFSDSTCGIWRLCNFFSMKHLKKELTVGRDFQWH